MSAEKSNIRLRFAPSPTGFMHIGNFRSALFGYLLAKSWRGKFILRIEDTDQTRKVEGAMEQLIVILQKLGIQFSEGPHVGGKYGPYVQTERQAIYDQYVKELLDKGQAYRCFCSEERLTEMRAEQEANKQPPRYDRMCRELSTSEVEKKLSNGESFVIRQMMPLIGEVRVHDELRGEIKFSASDLDDQVLIKSNGIPTYQFANIVDDHLMEISYVTRGAEWLSSFPKNILLYQAFGWTPPRFIHLPLILNKEGGGKLSKRRGDVFLEDFLSKGYLPEAIINFCVLLGWHPKSDQEFWTLAELEKDFTLDGMGASPAVFDIDKLDFYNAYYIRKLDLAELTNLCRPYLENAGLAAQSDKQLEKFVALSKDRLKKLSDISELSGYLFNLPPYDGSALKWKKISLEESVLRLKELTDYLQTISEEDWQTIALESSVLNWIKEQGQANGDYLWPLRYALTGQQYSPGPFEVADALGKTESLRRIKLALEKNSH
jgi:glutamyl-tRNA synthetase